MNVLEIIIVTRIINCKLIDNEKAEFYIMKAWTAKLNIVFCLDL